MKKIVLVILCVLLLAGGSYVMIPFISGLKYRNDVPERCYVSTGGGMLGGYRILKLDRDDEGNACLELRTKNEHSEREVKTVYEVSEDAFSVLAGIVNDYDLYAASKRPDSGIQVLDGDTTSISFDYSKGDFSISEWQSLTRKMSRGFREVIDYLESLKNDSGVTTIEAQTATLYLDSGYTLQFIVEDAFDGKLDDILSEEYETSKFEDCGIILNEADDLDCTGSEEVTDAGAGSIIYDAQGRFIILYEDHTFDQPVHVTAVLDGYVSSACPLIAEMEGPYSLFLN